MNNKIFKRFLVIILIVSSLFIITGCNTNITSNDNNSKSNNTQTSENNSSDDDSKSSNNTTPQKDSKVVNIKSEKKSEADTKHYLIISGLNSNDEVVWEYTTSKAYTGQYNNIELLGEFQDSILLNESGTINAIDKQTGELIWHNSDYQGSGSYCVFDDDGYLYITSCTSPRLYVISPDGKTITKVNDIDASDFYEPSNIEIIEDNLLRITYPSYMDSETEIENEIIADIRDIKNTKNVPIEKETVAEFGHTQIGGFEDIKNFALDSNGTVTVTFEPYTDFYQEYPNGKLELATDVKSISPVFWGNGGYGSLVMVKKDGTVLVLDSMNVSLGDITTRDLDLQNIEYVIEILDLDGSAYGLVDKDGNIFTDRV